MNIILIYIFNTFLSAKFYRGIFVLYLLDNGLNMLDVGILQSVLFWTIVVVEIPSGYFADKFGRRRSLLTAVALLILSALGMIYSNSFSFFALVFVLEGLSIACSSGANQALLYNYLSSNNRGSEYLKHSSRISSISSATLGIAVGLGGVLQAIEFELVYWVTTACLLVSFISIFLFKETMECKSDNNKEEESSLNSDNVQGMLKNYFNLENPTFIILFLLSIAFSESIMTMLFIYGQFILPEKGLSIESVATVFSVLQLSTAVIYLLSEKVNDHFGLTRPVILVSILSFVLLIIFIPSVGTLSIILFFLIMILPDFVELSIDNFFQNEIKEELRATITSIRSMVTSILTTILYITFGYLFHTSGLEHSLTILALVYFVVILSIIASIKLMRSAYESYA